jgi:mannose-6-phosphate isomerase-like protein (cupin superfamily)
MPTRVVDTSNVEHYTWGGAQGADCDGWYLVKTPELTVIEELMPPGTQEERHQHSKTRQFFFVLEGELTIEVEHHDFVVGAGKGIEVHPGQAHQAINRGAVAMRMVVTSQPDSHGDRTPA